MKKIVFSLFFLSCFSLIAQDFQGQAFYKTQTAMDFGSWGDRMSVEQKKAMKERMKPFLEPVYILTFDKTKSIYKQEETLDAPGSGGGRGVTTGGALPGAPIEFHSTGAASWGWASSSSANGKGGDGGGVDELLSPLQLRSGTCRQGQGSRATRRRRREQRQM